MIEVRDLVFRFSGSSFQLALPLLSIARGEAVAVVGPSGSGKTTLLHLLAGIYRPQAGSIRVAGFELTHLADAARRSFRIAHVGMVFQDFQLLDYLNVRENILLPYRLHSRLKLNSAVRRAADTLAASVDLGDKLARPIQRLSHGERQRVAICRALLPGPQLILADEPTGNLDPDNKQRILRLLRQRAREAEATLIVVTHDHSLLPLFDRVVDIGCWSATPVPSEEA